MKSILISNLHKSIEEINFLDLVIKLTGGIIVLKGWAGKTFNFYAIYAPILYSAQPPSIMVSATPCSPAKIVNPYNSSAPPNFYNYFEIYPDQRMLEGIGCLQFSCTL